MSRRWWTEDEQGRFEHREATLAVVECAECGKDVPLLAETTDWVEKVRDSRIWRHLHYGPAMGECCGRIYADWWEGTFVFGVEPERRAGGHP